MRIKSKPQDFRVRELLREGYLAERGRWRVYRVTKSKLTSLEAARELAEATGVRAADVGLAGLKDRQGVTTQFMSVRGGRPVRFRTPFLTVETAGFAAAELSSKDSVGNAFEIVLRGVTARERDEIAREADVVREHGLPNYYGEQRFGNLRHGQGWIAKELMLGRPEAALRALLSARSEHDNPRLRAFKRGLDRAWGDWKACRDVAGTFGAHHSIFEHLAREPEDFAGAFRYVKSDLRLIHLFAWQSHLWNRAVARWLSDALPRRERFLVPSIEGPFVFPRGALPAPGEWNGSFRVPGERLEDVTQAEQRRWFEVVLGAEGLAPADFSIQGVSGFALKGEERALCVRPQNLAIEPHLRDEGRLRVSFDLPRGAYATLVLARLAPSRQVDTPEVTARRAQQRDEDAAPGRAGAGPRGRRPESAGPRGERQRGGRRDRKGSDR